MNPRNIYHPDHNQRVKIPFTLPNVTDNDGVFQAFIRQTTWGQQLTTAMASYDVSALQRGDYFHVRARDIVTAFEKTPKDHWDKLLSTMISLRLIMEGSDLSLLPPGCGITSANIGHFVDFQNPIVSYSPPPLEENVVYVYTDASVVALKDSYGNPTITYSGYAYLIIHNGVVVDEGITKGPDKPLRNAPTSSNAELLGVNLGLRAAYIYLNLMATEERDKVTSVCIRTDSQGAVSQSVGASLLWARDVQARQIIWATYNVMKLYDLVSFEYIPRELNGPADHLASYARCLQQSKTTKFDRTKFDKLCKELVEKEVKIGFKVRGANRSVVA